MSCHRSVVALEDVYLCYRLAKQKIPSLKEYAIHWMKGSLAYEELWALRAVSLKVARGEALGIIGRNGAGKSTLLKVISKVLRPTRGQVVVRGTVAPILELGTGFDHELTGYENMYLNALLLGHTRKEIDERGEEIIDFSGLRDFIHSPVRNYSTGMLARLGFAIATAWVPDILILDEVLAVGDARFLAKSERRMASFRDRGTSLILVSHDLGSIRKTCERAVWLESGRIEAEGGTEEVIESYLRFSRESDGTAPETRGATTLGNRQSTKPGESHT